MGQQQTNTTEVITAEVNGSRFLAHMRHLFSSTTIFVAELMQNARRARATAVRFELGEDHLVITDDGVGVGDFAKLIAVAESGWNDETQQNEDPFGIGFCSVIFAAKHVAVESRGRKVELTAEAVTARTPIDVVTADFIGGTRVTLTGLAKSAEKLKTAIDTYAVAFGIPVHLNGAEIQRPHAVEHLPFVIDTAVGKMFIPGLGCEDVTQSAVLESEVIVYCQGLPIRANTGGHLYSRDPNSRRPVLHIDHKVWKPRVPDRDALIDAEAAKEAITKAMHDAWLAEMVERKPNMSALDFVGRYWNLATRIGCLDVMNDVPVLPTCALSVLEGYPIASYWESGYVDRAAPVTAEEVQAGTITLFRQWVGGAGENCFHKLMLARKLGWVAIDQPLPAGHWAAGRVIDLEELSVTVAGKTMARGQFSGRMTAGTVKLMESLSLVVELDGKSRQVVSLSEPIAVGQDQYETVFLVPTCSEDASMVLRQASSYLDDMEHFEETDLEFDQRDFDNMVAMLAGEPPAETLRKCIRDIYGKRNLPGKSFTVSFDAEGKFTVVEMGTAAQ